MNAFTNLIRHKVSRANVRMRQGDFDLDLTYITQRIIAMGFPSTGFESSYRNPAEAVCAFLRQHHPNHFKIINLSERVYSDQLFDAAPIAFCPFPDHHAPPYPLLIEVMQTIHEWLEADPSNVVAVHCLAGHGRTGVIICCSFLFEGIHTMPSEALAEFAQKRSKTAKGIGYPSQRRYVYYAAEHLNVCRASGADIFKCLPSRAIRLDEAEFRHIWVVPRACRYLFVIFDARFDVVYNSAWIAAPEIETRNSFAYRPNLVITGDFTVKLFAKTKSVKEILRVSLNTRFIESGAMPFPKAELDGPHSDLKHKLYTPNITLILQYEHIAEDACTPEPLPEFGLTVPRPDGQAPEEEDDADTEMD